MTSSISRGRSTFSVSSPVPVRGNAVLRGVVWFEAGGGDLMAEGVVTLDVGTVGEVTGCSGGGRPDRGGLDSSVGFC